MGNIKKSYSPELINNIIEMYKNHTLMEVCRFYKKSRIKIKNILLENNIKIKYNLSYSPNFISDDHEFFRDLHLQEVIGKSNYAITKLNSLGYYYDKYLQILYKNGKKINIIESKWGYLYFGLNIMNHKYAIKIHRLIGYLKYGDKIFDKNLVIRHLNDIKTDNSWDNLVLGTHKENSMDVPSDKRLSMAKHASTFGCTATKKLTDEQAISLVEKYKQGFTNNDLMIEYNISSATVSGIIKGRFYSNITGLPLTTTKRKRI